MNTPATLTAIAAAHADRAATARQHLADKIATGHVATSLTAHLHALITAEVTAKVYADTVGMLDHGAAPGTIRDYLTALVLEDPNDTWTGRGNDAERVRADAVRAAVRELRSIVKD